MDAFSSRSVMGLIVLAIHAVTMIWALVLIFFHDFGIRDWIRDWKAVLGTILVIVFPVYGPVTYLVHRELDGFFEFLTAKR